MTVAELQNTMDNGEYMRWVAFYNLENQRKEIEYQKSQSR